MIAAAIVCAAAASQAATFNWATDNDVYMPYAFTSIKEGANQAAATSGASSRKINGTTWSSFTWLADITLTDADSLESKTTSGVAMKFGNAKVSTGNIANDVFSIPTSAGVAKKIDYSIIITGTYTDAKGTKWTVTSDAITSADPLEYYQGDMNTLSTGVPTKWSITAESVPEPTSGLLLLLGVAGLALKRKRA